MEIVTFILAIIGCLSGICSSIYMFYQNKKFKEAQDKYITYDRKEIVLKFFQNVASFPESEYLCELEYEVFYNVNNMILTHFTGDLQTRLKKMYSRIIESRNKHYNTDKNETLNISEDEFNDLIYDIANDMKVV